MSSDHFSLRFMCAFNFINILLFFNFFFKFCHSNSNKLVDKFLWCFSVKWNPVTEVLHSIIYFFWFYNWQNWIFVNLYFSSACTVTTCITSELVWLTCNHMIIFSKDILVKYCTSFYKPVRSILLSSYFQVSTGSSQVPQVLSCFWCVGIWDHCAGVVFIWNGAMARAKWSWGEQRIKARTSLYASSQYRRIFVYTFCLINICLSLSDDANKIKTLNIERA